MNQSATDSQAVEPSPLICTDPGTPGSITINRTAWPTHEVSIRTAGTAVYDSDYYLQLPDGQTGSYSNGVLTFTLPASPTNAPYTIQVIPLRDYVVETESANFSFDTALPNTSMSGTATVNIAEAQVTSPTLTVPNSIAMEYGTQGEILFTPNPGGTLSDSYFFWELDTRALNSALLKQSSNNPLEDYSLADDLGPLIFYPIANEPGVLISNLRHLVNQPSARLVVHPISDNRLEGDETVTVRVNYVDCNQQNPSQTLTGTVTIKEEYWDAKVEHDAIADSCNVCVDGNNVMINKRDGQVSVGLADGLVTASSTGQENSYPVLQVGVPLPEGKAVPKSISANVFVVDKDTDENGELVGLGRKVIAANPAISGAGLEIGGITWNVPTEASAGSIAWFSIQTNVAALAKSWLEQSSGFSGVQERVLSFEVQLTPNFDTSTPANLRYSGLVGRTMHLLRDESHSERGWFEWQGNSPNRNHVSSVWQRVRLVYRRFRNCTKYL